MNITLQNDVQYFIVSTLALLIAIFSVTFNSFVIWIFFKSKEIRTPSNFFKLNIVVFDLLMAVFISFPITISTGRRSLKFYDDYCEIHTFFLLFIRIARWLAVAVLTQFKFEQVCKNANAVRKLTYKTVFLLTIAISILSCTFASFYVYTRKLLAVSIDDNSSCNIFWINSETTMGKFYALFYSFAIIIVVKIFIIYFFIRIFRHQKHQAQQQQELEEEERAPEHREDNEQGPVRNQDDEEEPEVQQEVEEVENILQMNVYYIVGFLFCSHILFMTAQITYVLSNEKPPYPFIIVILFLISQLCQVWHPFFLWSSNKKFINAFKIYFLRKFNLIHRSGLTGSGVTVGIRKHRSLPTLFYDAEPTFIYDMNLNQGVPPSEDVADSTDQLPNIEQSTPTLFHKSAEWFAQRFSSIFSSSRNSEVESNEDDIISPPTEEIDLSSSMTKKSPKYTRKAKKGRSKPKKVTVVDSQASDENVISPSIQSSEEPQLESGHDGESSGKIKPKTKDVRFKIDDDSGKSGNE